MGRKRSSPVMDYMEYIGISPITSQSKMYRTLMGKWVYCGKPEVSSPEEFEKIVLNGIRPTIEEVHHPVIHHRLKVTYEQFDPTGVFDDEWREMRKFLKEQWYKGYELGKLTDLEIMLKHGGITWDEYCYYRWENPHNMKYFKEWIDSGD